MINWTDFPFAVDPDGGMGRQVRFALSRQYRTCPMCNGPIRLYTGSLLDRADIHEIVPRAAFTGHPLQVKYGALPLIPFGLRIPLCHACNVGRVADNANGRKRLTLVQAEWLGASVILSAVHTLDVRFSGCVEQYTRPIKEVLK